MQKILRALRHPSILPIFLLLLINLAAGLLTYRDFGLSWDEPLFYDYADSIRLAYTPQAFSPSFDFEQVYGPSATDHKYYGPAYILAAHPVQQAVMAVFNADRAAAWHLVNFLTFQIGLLFFYLLLLRWFDPWPAAAASAFFAWQPVVWGHAFINPKDMPFMVFFVAAVTVGFWMVDAFSGAGPRKRWGLVVLAGILLGATVAIRVIGPLAGLVVFAYFVLQRNWRAIPGFVVYGLIALLVMFAGWPFLWADPLNRMIEVARHMSDNPTQLAVVFMGELFRAPTLPRRYLAQMLAIALTEPTWILFAIGLGLALLRVRRAGMQRYASALIVISWFVLMLGYVLISHPPLYDGFRHFLFILPPVFVAAGFVFEWLYERLWISAGRLTRWAWPGVVALVLLPGLLGMIQLHPYEYAYYNTFVGGTGGAYRVYETDYWLTCYKESLAWIQTNEPGKTVYIQREFGLASYYADGMTLKDLGAVKPTDIQPGDLLLFSTRGDLDIRSSYAKMPTFQSIGRAGAHFCLIKQK